MNIILKISAFIFPLITLPYITRTLGAVGNGKVAFASSVITYFSMFAQLGIPTYGIRACAKCRDDQDKLTQTVQELLLINIVAVVIAYLALIVCELSIPKLQEESGLILINSITLILNMFGMEWLYQAIEQYQYITIRNLFFKIVSIVLMFVFVHDPNDYIIYGAISVVSAGGSNVLNLLHSRKVLAHRTFIGKYNLRQHLKPIFVFFALSIAVSIYTSMDTVMLGFMSNDKEVAYYALATKLKMILALTVSALGPVLLPRMTYCLNNGQYCEFKSYIAKSLHFVILASIPCVVYCYYDSRGDRFFRWCGISAGNYMYASYYISSCSTWNWKCRLFTSTDTFRKRNINHVFNYLWSGHKLYCKCYSYSEIGRSWCSSSHCFSRKYCGYHPDMFRLE